MKRSMLCLLCALLLLAPIFAHAQTDVVSQVMAPYFTIVDACDPTHAFYSKNADATAYPSSTIKILTCLIAIETCDLNETVTVSKNAASLPETHSLMGLKSGERIIVRDLLYGMMLASGNDAAIALAEHIGGSVEEFAVLMNERAAQLGMKNSHFVNPHGVHTAEQYTTAADMAVLASYAIGNETFLEITGTIDYTVPANDVRKSKIELHSSNWLLGTGAERYYYEYAIGGKTGSSASQGKCLVTMAKRDGVTLVCCMFGLTEGGDITKRLQITFEDSKYLFEQVYDNFYSTVSAFDLGLKYSTELDAVSNCAEGEGALELRGDFAGQTVYLGNDIIDGVKLGSIEPSYTVTLDNNIAAPVEKGQSLGWVDCSLDGRTIFSGELVATRAVAEFVPTLEPTAIPTPTASPTLEPVATPTSAPVTAEQQESDSSALTAVLIAAALAMVLCIMGLVILILRKKRS